MKRFKVLEIEIESLRNNLFSSEQKNQVDIPQDFVKFNEFIGNPKHPATGKPSPMTPYQIDLDELIDKYGWILVNKSKKIGITESALRSIARRCFSKYAGAEVMLCAGNKERHAISLMERFTPLFNRLRDSIVEQSNTHLKLNNGTVINAYPSNAEALIGRPLVKCIYLDEAAYTGIINDQPVFDNLFANISNTHGDFIITSTPNGMRGFFFEMCQRPSEGWYYVEYDYLHGLEAMLLDKDVIEKAKKDPAIDFDQLYRCKFTTTRASIFGDQFIEQDYEAEEY